MKVIRSLTLSPNKLISSRNFSASCTILQKPQKSVIIFLQRSPLTVTAMPFPCSKITFSAHKSNPKVTSRRVKVLQEHHVCFLYTKGIITIPYVLNRLTKYEVRLTSTQRNRELIAFVINFKKVYVLHTQLCMYYI